MSKKKSEEQEVVEEQVAVITRKFYFPKQNVSIDATSREEAIKLLEEQKVEGGDGNI